MLKRSFLLYQVLLIFLTLYFPPLKLGIKIVLNLSGVHGFVCMEFHYKLGMNNFLDCVYWILDE